MAFLLKNARIIDPQAELDGVCDVLLDGERICAVGDAVEAALQNLSAVEEMDLSGKIILPGLFDMHVHFREPGYEQKEDIASGSRAAVHGGFTGVCCMPNTLPVADTASVIEYIRAMADRADMCKVYPAGSCTQGLKGEILSEMGDMSAHGAVAFTDDGRGIQLAGMMRRVMDYAVQFGHPVMSHCQDEDLVGEGQVNEGVISTRLGMFGWPAEGEEIQIARDIALCRLTKCPLHIQHISTERGLNLVRAAKAEGLPVTCEATPHHLFLCEDDISDDYNTFLKVNPPLRTAKDAAALIEGVQDGSIDAIVTDHAPHTAYEKDREFELAPFGMIGLETSLSLMVSNLVSNGSLSWNRLVELMAINPRKILGLEPVSIKEGSLADLTILDPEATWTVEPDSFESKANNSGFIGFALKGRATDLFVNGRARMLDGRICS